VRRHIIYLPGLGDGYDGIRRIGLGRWTDSKTVVTHLPMHWRHQTETMDNKLRRLNEAVQLYPQAEIWLVGESAGGAMALVAYARNKAHIKKVVTLCGMNHGADSVSPHLYKKNPAFQTVMTEVDRVVSSLSTSDKLNLCTLYSSYDRTVLPSHSRIPGVDAYDLKTPTHMLSILSVLYWRYRLITAALRS
jgi:pimeloyl-ACP methyl ester carboxylesterase